MFGEQLLEQSESTFTPIGFIDNPIRKETEQLILRASPPDFLVDASGAAKDFVLSCLARKSHLRPSAWQLLRFPWIKVNGENGACDFMTRWMYFTLTTTPLCKYTLTL
jgi:hypothetical protein